MGFIPNLSKIRSMFGKPRPIFWLSQLFLFTNSVLLKNTAGISRLGDVEIVEGGEEVWSPGCGRSGIWGMGMISDIVLGWLAVSEVIEIDEDGRVRLGRVEVSG